MVFEYIKNPNPQMITAPNALEHNDLKTELQCVCVAKNRYFRNTFFKFAIKAGSAL